MVVFAPVKVCARCKQNLSVSKFGRDQGRRDGYSIYCLDCRRARYYERGGSEAVRRRKPKACEECGEQFHPWGPGQKFCSIHCRWTHQTEVKTCERCGGPYQGKGNRRFCSRDCWQDSRSRRRVQGDGYVMIKVPPGTLGASSDRSWMKEHRYVMQQILGRPLAADEHVHHINGDRGDNRAENLELWCTHHPKGQRPQDLVEWAREIIARYGE